MVVQVTNSHNCQKSGQFSQNKAVFDKVRLMSLKISLFLRTNQTHLYKRFYASEISFSSSKAGSSSSIYYFESAFMFDSPFKYFSKPGLLINYKKSSASYPYYISARFAHKIILYKQGIPFSIAKFISQSKLSRENSDNFAIAAN